MPHDYLSELRSISEEMLTPQGDLLVALAERYREDPERPVGQANALAREMTLRLRRHRKESSASWSGSLSTTTWERALRHLAMSGALPEEGTAVRELLRMVRYKRGRSSTHQELLKAAAGNILLHLPTLSSPTLLQAAREVPEFQEWIVKHPAADAAVWEAMLERFEIRPLTAALATHPRALAESERVRRYLLEEAEMNSMIALELARRWTGEIFRKTFPVVVRRNPLNAIALLKEHEPSTERPLSRAELEFLLSHPLAEVREGAITLLPYLESPSEVGPLREQGTEMPSPRSLGARTR